MTPGGSHDEPSNEPAVTIRTTDETLPYGAVTNDVTDGWAVIHVERLEVLGERLFPTLDEALAAAAERRRHDEVQDRANRNFDEEMTLWREDGGFGTFDD